MRKERWIRVSRQKRVWKGFVAVLLLLLPCGLVAGSITQWRMPDVEKAPVLVVGHVGSMRREFRVPQGTVRWHAEVWVMRAQVTVLRSFAGLGGNAPSAGSHVDVRFLAYAENHAFVNGPPPLAFLRAGDTVILPLLDNLEPHAQPWRLMAVDGIGLTIPARSALFRSAMNVNTGRQFILRELANSLAEGTPEEITAAAGYVHDQSENLTPELMPLLQGAIGNDGQRWAEIEVGLMGISRPTIEDLRAGGWRDSNWNPSVDHGYSIASLILKRLAASPDSHRWVMRAIVEKAAFFPESASFLAQDYASDSDLTGSLHAALKERQPGAIYLACVLINEGQRMWVPEALASAQELLKTRPRTKHTRVEDLDRSAARSLLAEPTQTGG